VSPVAPDGVRASLARMVYGVFAINPPLVEAAIGQLDRFVRLAVALD